MKKPKIFIQDCGSYTNEILVICGATKKETYSFMKKKKIKHSCAKWVLEDFDHWQEKLKTDSGALFAWNSQICAMAMILNKPKNDWRFFENLLHECHHAVWQITKQKAIQEEPENQAYLFDFLFRNIRRKIDGLDSI